MTTKNRNYKTFDVTGEAHRIMNQLRLTGSATGDSIAHDTVRHFVQNFGINGNFHVDCPYTEDCQNAVYTLVGLPPTY